MIFDYLQQLPEAFEDPGLGQLVHQSGPQASPEQSAKLLSENYVIFSKLGLWILYNLVPLHDTKCNKFRREATSIDLLFRPSIRYDS